MTERCVVGDAELRLGRWQAALADVLAVDQIICDAPYSPRTHTGRRTGSEIRQSSIDYDPITPEQCAEFAESWKLRVREWIVVFGDDVSAGWWKRALGDAGLYVFAAVPWVKPDAAPRMSGDGPASAAEYIVVARRRTVLRRPGSRPGYYFCGTGSTRGNHGEKAHPGAKPLPLMQSLVLDYSEPGDLICDPFAGSATTLRAAVIEGRRAVGSESAEPTYRAACDRLRGFGPALTRHGQSNLFVPETVIGDQR